MEVQTHECIQFPGPPRPQPVISQDTCSQNTGVGVEGGSTGYTSGGGTGYATGDGTSYSNDGGTGYNAGGGTSYSTGVGTGYNAGHGTSYSGDVGTGYNAGVSTGYQAYPDSYEAPLGNVIDEYGTRSSDSGVQRADYGVMHTASSAMNTLQQAGAFMWDTALDFLPLGTGVRGQGGHRGQLVKGGQGERRDIMFEGDENNIENSDWTPIKKMLYK